MGNKGIGAFVLGGVIGAAVALLYAPRAGVETRAMVADRANAAWGDARDFGARAQVRGQEIYENASVRGQEFYANASARGQEIYENASARGQELYETAQVRGQAVREGAAARVQEAAETIKPVFTEKNDELREKIEAARQRIAAQVAKNAEQAPAEAPVVEVEPAEVVEEQTKPDAE